MGTEKLGLAILKKWIGSIAWSLLLWANSTKEEDYWREAALPEIALFPEKYIKHGSAMTNITEQPCQCLRCGWIGIVWDCEGDVDGDGSLSCPECLAIVDMYDEKNGNWQDALENNLLKNTNIIAQSGLKEDNRLMETMREKFAELAHVQWSHWMVHLFKKTISNGDGSLTIPPDLVEQWERQMCTPYAELPIDEKKNAREEADKVLATLVNWFWRT